MYFYAAPVMQNLSAVDRITTAWAPASTVALISARWACMAAVSHHGMTSAAPLPFLGQIAPKMYAEVVR